MTAHSPSHQNAHTHLVHKSFFCPPLFLFLSFIPSFLYFRLYRLELVQYKKNKTPSSTIIYFLSSPPLLSFTLKNHHPLTFNNPYQPRSHRFFISQPITSSSSHINRPSYKVTHSISSSLLFCNHYPFQSA